MPRRVRPAAGLSGNGVDFHSEQAYRYTRYMGGTAVYSAGSSRLEMPVLTRLYMQDISGGAKVCWRKPRCTVPIMNADQPGMDRLCRDRP